MKDIKGIDPRVEKILELKNKRDADVEDLTALKKLYEEVCNYKNTGSIDIIRIKPERYGKETESLEFLFGDRSIPVAKDMLQGIVKSMKETLEKHIEDLEDEICHIDNSFKGMLSDKYQLPPVKPIKERGGSLYHSSSYSDLYGSWSLL